MKISPLSLAEQAIVNANDRLHSYLDSLERRIPSTPRSWLYENVKDPKDILDAWIKVLSSLEKSDDPIYRRVYLFDLKQVEKFGPQGGHPPMKEGIKTEAFVDQFKRSPVKTVSFRNLSDILRIRPRSINYRSFDAVLDDMASRDTLVTNSGWPLFRVRKLVKSESVRQAKDGSAWRFPAILLFRTYNGKLRIVWMYPMAMNLLEYTATQPLQDVITRSTQYVTPWKGFEEVKHRFTALWKAHPFAFGGDTTAMDAHMQLPQLDAVGQCAASLFSDPEIMIRTLRHVAEIPIVIGTKSKISETHGVASGSGWTQLSETIFQIGMFDEYIRSRSLPITVEDGMGIGDDYVWFFDEKPDEKDIVSFWEERGLPGKPEKQSNEADYCTFLQRLFIKGFYSRDDATVLGGVYPTIRALNSLIFPEKYHKPKLWSKDAFAIRCVQIMENCVDHPLFVEFVKFVANGHSYLTEFAKTKTDSQLNRIHASVRNKLPGLVPTYNQEKRSKPLSAYTTVKVLRSL